MPAPQPPTPQLTLALPRSSETWHEYEPGQRVNTDEVVTRCEQHINSGKVKNPEQKLRGIEAIRNCGHPVIVYSPRGSGWGGSPMNPNSWRTPEGRPIIDSAPPGTTDEGTVSIDEPVIAININRQFPHVRSAEDLYQCTRGFWRLNMQRAEKAKYAFAVYQGLVKEVYEINRWLPASDELTEYFSEKSKSLGNEGKLEKPRGRYEFIGKLAPESIRQKYVGHRMPVAQTQNPIRYFNCSNIGEKVGQESNRRQLSEEEKEQIRARILKGDDSSEKIARDFNCSLNQVAALRAWTLHSDSWK
jgi:hypothetical protein